MLDGPDSSTMSYHSELYGSASASVYRAPQSTPEPDQMDHDGVASESRRSDAFGTADPVEQLGYLAMHLRRAERAIRRGREGTEKIVKAKGAPGERGRIAKQGRPAGRTITRPLSPMSEHVSVLLQNRELIERDLSPDVCSDRGCWSGDEFGSLSLTGICSIMPSPLQSVTSDVSNVQIHKSL